jgi:hypothetical protein
MVVLNSVLIWELFVYEFLLGIRDIFLCIIHALLVNVTLLDVLGLLMLFAWTLTHLETKVFLIIYLFFPLIEY